MQQEADAGVSGKPQSIVDECLRDLTDERRQRRGIGNLGGRSGTLSVGKLYCTKEAIDGRMEVELPGTFSDIQVGAKRALSHGPWDDERLGRPLPSSVVVSLFRTSNFLIGSIDHKLVFFRED